jgi:hypothetical protein
MTDTIARFHQRREAQRAAAAVPRLVLLPTAQAAQQLALEAVDDEFVDAAHPLDLKLEQRVTDANELCGEAAAAYNRDRFDAMIAELQNSVLHSIATPFGGGKLLSAFDKDGGNVATIHNVRQGVYASEAERRCYVERAPMTSSAAYQDQKYRDANKRLSDQVHEGTAIDTYTGAAIKPSHRHDKQLGPSMDHVVSLYEIDADPGRVLAGLTTPEVANIDSNLAPTTKTVNSKKKAHSPEQLGLLLEQQAPARRARLQELEGRKAGWTDSERKEYNKLKAQDGINIERVKDKEKEARAKVDARINKEYYASGKFVRQAAFASATEGAKMGLQQALGVVLVEFLGAIIGEVKDFYRQGMREESFVKEVGVRLRRVAKRVAGKWKAALTGLSDGSLSGLLSSLVTTLINAFVTTCRRAVRMIREGFNSLVHAVKLLLFRPEKMTSQQALHEASKILVGAGVLVGGIALEEVVSKQLTLVPGLGVIAEPATAAIVGAVTAIATSFAVYLLDQADFFGVQAEARAKAVGEALDQRLAKAIASLEAKAIAMESGIARDTPVAAANGFST